jgi:hypothetical protein
VTCTDRSHGRHRSILASRPRVPSPRCSASLPAAAPGPRGPAAERDDTAAALGITPGSPVLVTRTRYYITHGKIIEYAETSASAGHWHTLACTITGI